MKCAVDEYSQLSAREGKSNGIQVAHFSYQNEIRIFPGGHSQGVRETLCVGADLSLGHQRFLVFMNKFQRIFYRNDVAFTVAVDLIDHSSQSRGFATACRSDHENQPFL